MRIAATTIATLAILLLAGGTRAVRAQIQIDPFFVPTSLLEATPGNPVFEDSNLTINGFPSTRRISASASGTFTLDTEVDGTGWIIDGGGTGAGSANAEAEYLGYSLNLGTNYFFEFSVNRVFGNPVLGVILQNTSAGLTLSGGAALTPTTNGYSVFIDVRTLSNYTPAFLNGLDDINVFVGAADQNVFVEASQIQFSPVPEPATWALMAMAGGLALVVARRATHRASRRE